MKEKSRVAPETQSFISSVTKVSHTASVDSLKDLDGKNIFIQGDLKSERSAFDALFNMRAAGQPLLERKVQILQFDNEKARD